MRDAQNSHEELLTLREVARALRVDSVTVRRWIKYDILAAIELPGRGVHRIFRIRQSTLDALLAGSARQERKIV